MRDHTLEVDNMIQSDYHADHPYEKLLTDLTEFALPDGKLYLSAMIDCFDGMTVGWTIGNSSNAEFVNSMLDGADERSWSYSFHV